MTGVSNAQLAAAVNDLVAKGSARDAQLAEWLSGVPTGGPNGDGKYPLSDYIGNTRNISAPAKLEALVTDLVSGAEGALAETTDLRDEVVAHLATVELRTTQASDHAAAADTSKTQADTFRQQAAASEANALVHRNAASGSATAAAASATLADERADAADASAIAAAASASAANTSANSAAASAILAATFDPASFYTKTQADTLLAAKLAAADFTWTNLSGKPTTFTPSAHTHVIADVTGLQAALDGKQPTGSYLTSITGSMVTTALGYTPANRAGDTFTGLVTVSGSGLNAAVRLSNTTGGRDWRVTQKDDGRFVITDETAGAERFAINSSGSVTAFTDLRAPIFYDSNNTGYYVDPASTSALARVQIDTLVTNGQSPAISFKGDIDGAKWFQKLGGYNLSFMNDSGAGFDSATFDGRTYYNKFYLTNSGSAIAYGDVRAPLFYDSNNTAYYVDPASTSVINGLNVGTNAPVFSNGSFQYHQYQSPHVAYIKKTGGYNWYWRRNDTGLGGGANEVEDMSLTEGGNLLVRSDVRAPLFYDNNDTSFYVDPNGASRVNTFGIVTETLYPGSIDADYTSGYYHFGPGNATPTGGYGHAHIIRLNASWNVQMFFPTSNTNEPFWIRRKQSGTYSSWRRMIQEDEWMGSKYLSSDGNIWGTAFYDANDGSYYVDPNGNTRLRNVCLGGGAGFDASIHIVGAQGGYDRLTQMSPNAASKPALNIMASRNSGNGDQWWSWGVQTDNTWKIQAGVGFGGNGITIDNSGNFTATGNVTAYSDVRLKKDVETISGALDLVSQLRGVRYTRIDSGERQIGVIAQETLAVIPEVVQRGIGDDDTLSVAYGNLVGVLIEAVKELRAEVETLKASQGN